VPQASYFVFGKSHSDTATFSMRWDEQREILELHHLGDSTTRHSFVLEKENWRENNCYHLPMDYCYWQLLDEEQHIVYYELVEPASIIAKLKNENCESCTLRIFYKQYFFEKKWDELIEELSKAKTETTTP
jgi:hypothetical protein